MKLVLTLVASLLVAQGQAASWSWFSSNDEQEQVDEDAVIDPAEAITQECLNLGAWGQCSFYDCMERRFPCGSEGYTEKVSKHFCSKIDRNYDQFNGFGRRWLNQTSICLHGYMLPIYNAESTTCGDIKRAGIEAVVNCNEGEVDGQNFCDFLNTNGDAYKGLMGSHEVRLLISLRDARVFRSMISDTVSCGLENFRDFAASATTRLTNFMGSLWNSIW